MGVEHFSKQMAQAGYYIFPEFISQTLVAKMTDDLEVCYGCCRRVQIENGVDNSEGTCHHLIGQADSFMECLREYENLDTYFTDYFQGNYILNSFGGNILTKNMSYANNIHRDIRSFSGTLPLMLNTIVFLDDFTKENGATWLMHRGHQWSDKPSEHEFEDYQFQITGKAGSVVVWNSNLWHRAGVNTTDKPRRSVTPELTRPFIKQGFDYSQFAADSTQDYLKQVLGYNSRTPHSLDQWYQPEKDRFYKGNQG